MPTKLKRTYATIDDVPETFRPFFVEKDGRAQLDVEIEGFAPASKIDEMRQTNLEERRAHEAELAKFSDVDPEEYKTLKARSAELAEHKLIKKGDVDEVVRLRVEEALKPFRTKESEWTNEKASLKTKLGKSLIANQVVEAAIPLGLKKGAVRDLVTRAEAVFKLTDEGDVQAFEEDGTTPKHYLGDPYTFERFAQDTLASEDGKHLFEENSGANADARKLSGDSANGQINWWDPKTFNRSRQGELLVKNRPLAIKLAAKHGITIPPLPPGATAS